jgi:hypothetical protein
VINDRTPCVGVLLRALIVAPISVLLCFSQTQGHGLVDAERAGIYLKRIRSFIYDPLQAVDLDWLDLVVQIKEVEAFLAHYRDFRNREEAHFILSVDYVRAARQALDANSRMIYMARAQVVLQQFFTAYPGSLRETAARMLLESLPSVE